jgi:hypothetical protein
MDHHRGGNSARIVYASNNVNIQNTLIVA